MAWSPTDEERLEVGGPGAVGGGAGYPDEDAEDHALNDFFDDREAANFGEDRRFGRLRRRR
jgi:hypothetical protein